MSLFPHAAYAEAVHVTLAERGLAPDTTTVSVSPIDLRHRNLTITHTWEAGRLEVDATQWPHGMRLIWQHVHGWHLEEPATKDAYLLPLTPFAAPSSVSLCLDIAATQGVINGSEELTNLPGSTLEWDDARTLDRAVADWEASQL